MADAEQIKAWLAGLEQERASKAGETTGVGDLLALLGLAKQPLLTAGALADTAGPLPKFRTESGEDIDYTMAAVPSFKKKERAALLDAALKAGKQGPETPYHRFLDKQARLIAGYSQAQPWQKEFAATGQVPVVRAAKDITPPSDRRLGAFYNVETPVTRSHENQWLSGGQSTGGDVMYAGKATPRSPYVRNDMEGSPDQTFYKLRGKTDSFNTSTGNTSLEFQDLVGGPLTQERLNSLGKLGINRKEAQHIWSAAEGDWARRDAIVSKLLQKEGYDTLIETRPSSQGVMKAPELFKLREPRRNFSYDPRGDKPRGLDAVEFLAQFSRKQPKTQLTPEVLAEFAAGRSRALGKTVPAKGTARPKNTNVGKPKQSDFAKTWLDPEEDDAAAWFNSLPKKTEHQDATDALEKEHEMISKLAEAIGMKKTPGGKLSDYKKKNMFYLAPDWNDTTISGGHLNVTKQPTKADNYLYEKITGPSKFDLGGKQLLKNNIPGVLIGGDPAAARHPILSLIPGYSAKMYSGGKKMPKEKALELLTTYQTLYAPKNIPGAPKNTPLDDKIYETLLKSIKQAKR